jgi:hypothetical protein
MKNLDWGDVSGLNKTATRARPKAYHIIGRDNVVLHHSKIDCRMAELGQYEPSR